MKKYTEEETIAKLHEYINGGNLPAQQVYAEAKCINWKGYCKGAQSRPYTEVIAEELLKMGIKNRIESIPVITRSSSYKVTHSKTDTQHSNRGEELFARRLQGQTFSEIGEIIDYQMPLKNSRKDKGAGKIDLVSYSNQREPATAHLVEFKYTDNVETLLRAVLEIATYDQLLDKKKFIADFQLDPQTEINKAVLLMEGSNAYIEAQDLHALNRDHMRKLIRELGVMILGLSGETADNMKIRLFWP